MSRATVPRLRVWVFSVLAVACVLLVLLAGPAASAQAKDWRIDNVDVVLNVQENGDVIVDETYTYTFEGSFSFVARDIPTRAWSGCTDIEVRDANGAVLPEGTGPGTFTTYERDGVRSIEVNFSLADTTATWTYHYRAEAAVLFFDEGDELRWYVFDAATAVPVAKARATVILPGSVPSANLTHAIEVGYGVQTSVTSPAASTMVYEAAGFPPYTKFWIVTGFPKGTVEFTWTADRVAAFVVPKLGFALPILVFLGMLLVWRKRGRDEPAVMHANYVSEPPSALPPGLAGALIDEKVDTKEVIATIIDLARRGYLEITDTEKRGITRKTVTIFTRTRALDDLKGFEARVARALFDNKHPDQVTSDQLKNHFYTHVQPIISQVYEEVTKAGMFHVNPKRARNRWFGIGTAVAVVLALLNYIMYAADVTGWGWFMAGSVVSVLIIWAFAPHMPQRTARGAQEQRRWEAFRNYLKDLTRFQDMESARENFEKYLPYAIAFGVEKDWARRFEGLTVSSPDWYHPPIFVPSPGHYSGPSPGPSGPMVPGSVGGGSIGGGSAGGGGGRGFSLDTVSDGLFRSLGNMSSVLTSAPSGANKGAWGGGGGGGGFGGGFSGGGGGGGSRAG